MSGDLDPIAPKVVTFRPRPDGPYGDVVCSWEEKARKVPITEPAARKFAEGWKAEFRMEPAF